MVLFPRAAALVGFLMPLALAASPAGASTPRHYDCSKAGNANKSACRAAAAPAAAPAKAAKTRTTKTTTRHYDCTKPGNANKAACRTAASGTPTGKTTGAVTRTSKTTATTTDCTKWYNRMRATCRTSSSSSPARTTVAPAPKPAAAPGRSNASGASGERVNDNPIGAIAQCRDGSYSHSAHRAGTCSRHGGVVKWFQG